MRLIDADILKEAINTYDKFACLPNGKIYPFRDLRHPELFEAYIHFRDIIKAIDNAPTVTPDMAQVIAYESGKSSDRPKGKWMKEDKPWGGFGDSVLVNTCSECGESFVYHGNNPKYCPECGADMRGGHDNG